MALRKADGKPVSFGICCVCGKHCYSGQNIVAGEKGCDLRHKDCVRVRIPPKGYEEERWG